MTEQRDSQWTVKVLYAFESIGGDAACPNGGIIRDDSGRLYGTSVVGGKRLYGAVFEIIP